MSPKTALIIRATGSQGKGVVKHLIASGWNVHALVTDPDADRSRALKSFGEAVTLHKGSLSDSESLKIAIHGCTSVFLNQMPSFTDDAETREASNVIEAAKTAGIKHIVHSTTLPLNDPDIRFKLKDSIVAPAVFGKEDVENLVKKSGIPYTSIRPGFFMTNFITPIVDYMFPGFSSGTFLNSYAPSTVLPLVDTDDIGAAAAAAFNDPKKFSGKIMSIASEKLLIPEIVDEIKRASGKEMKIVYRTEEETAKAMGDPLIAGQLMSSDLANLVDLEEAKSYGIRQTSFREFLEKHKDAVPYIYFKREKLDKR